jgi:pimeloyl-ACP methyl ester carboxylesterase
MFTSIQARYPSDVAGLVLIDSSVPDMHEPDLASAPANRVSPREASVLCGLGRNSAVRRATFRGEPRALPPPSDFTSEQGSVLARLEAQPKAFRTDAEQACAATDEGRIVPREGGGNPDIDNAARNAGSLGDRPLVVLTAGRYWAPSGFEKEAAEYHQVQVHQLQTSLVRLSTRGGQVIVDAHHDMAESSDSIVIAVRQVVDEVRSSNEVIGKP